VHTPIQSPPALMEKYEKKRVAMGLDKAREKTVGEFYPFERKSHLRIERRIVQSHPGYAAMLENLDFNIGRLWEAVKAKGIWDDTIIFFTSDNGGLSTSEFSPTCNAPLSEGKGWLCDGGVREPLLVVGNGIEKNSVCNVPVTTPDFYPTIEEIAGLKPTTAPGIDGVSILPLLKGGKLPKRPLFWHYPHYGNQGSTPGSAVRFGEYKLIEYYEDGRRELYNIEDDIGETNNIVRNLPDVAAELSGMLNKWKVEIDAKIPTPNPDWK